MARSFAKALEIGSFSDEVSFAVHLYHNADSCRPYEYRKQRHLPWLPWKTVWSLPPCLFFANYRWPYQNRHRRAVRASLQSIMPAPVLSLNCFTIADVISNLFRPSIILTRSRRITVLQRYFQALSGTLCFHTLRHVGFPVYPLSVARCHPLSLLLSACKRSSNSFFPSMTASANLEANSLMALNGVIVSGNNIIYHSGSQLESTIPTMGIFNFLASLTPIVSRLGSTTNSPPGKPLHVPDPT